MSKIRKKKIKKANILLGFICILLAVLLGFILVTSYKSEQKESRHLSEIADDLMIKSGQDRFREAIGIYKSCLDSGNWYGYEGAFGMVNTLGLPKWVEKTLE